MWRFPVDRKSTLGYHPRMNIADEFTRFFQETGWSPYRLAKEAGIKVEIITRVQKGTRKGIHSSTLEKLWPFLYGDGHPIPAQEPKS